MGELDQMQRAFYACVTSGGSVDGIIASGDTRIYARMYASRLHDVLAADYPKVRTVVGDEAFGALVASYLERHAPRSHTLRDAGLDLPAFLAETAASSLAELAALERARIEVFDAADARPLTQEEVAALDVALPELELRLVPASAVVPLRWTVDDLWSAIEDGNATGSPEQDSRTVLVWRRGVAVVHRTLERDEAELAPSLTTGIRFADLCERLAEIHGDHAAVRATELLVRWLQAEMLGAS